MTSVALPFARPSGSDPSCDDPEEDLYAFLERHEAGPCPACPVYIDEDIPA